MTGSLDATAAPPLDVEHDVRPHFPAFKADDNSFIFADNAGGSQILGSCVAAISDYLVGSNVQLGGGYAHSTRAAQLVAKGYEATAAITNVAGGASQCVIGSSTTQLASNLGVSCERGDLFKHGDEIVLSAADHEGASSTLTGQEFQLITSVLQRTSAHGLVLLNDLDSEFDTGALRLSLLISHSHSNSI